MRAPHGAAAVRCAAALAALALLVACAGEGGERPDAAATDAGVTDAGIGADIPAPADAGPHRDATPDARHDAALDAGRDATRDARHDAVPDAGRDATPDVRRDAPGDSGPADGAARPDVPAADGGTGDAGPDAPSWNPDAPAPAVTVTVNRIPAAQNGSVPYLGPGAPETAFRLRLPPARWTIDVTARPQDGGPPVDPAAITATLTVAPSGDDAYEETLTDPPAWDGATATWTVSEDAPLPAGEVTLAAAAADLRGVVGDAAPLTVDVAPLPAHLDPFATPDVWLATFSRDLFALTLVENDDGTYGLEPELVEGGNGVPDFDEAFLAMGLFSANEEVTAVVRARLIARIREVAAGVFGLDAAGRPVPGGVPIVLWFEGDEGAPDEAAVLGGEVSRIAIGGDGDAWDIENRIVGRAWIDPNNQAVEDDGAYGLGVFTSQIVRLVIGNPVAWIVLRDISPVVGTPIGLGPRDAELVDPDFDPRAAGDPALAARHALLTLAIDLGGLGAGVTLAHEMGHSLGLVAPGAPPAGLFAGIPGLPFVDTESEGWHIDTPEFNVMQTGRQTNWFAAATGNPVFTPLNLAYLQRRLVVDPAAAKARPVPWTAPACGCGHARPSLPTTATPPAAAPGRAVPVRTLLAR